MIDYPVSVFTIVPDYLLFKPRQKAQNRFSVRVRCRECGEPMLLNVLEKNGLKDDNRCINCLGATVTSGY